MFVSDCLDINEKGHLTIGGCDAVGLAEQFGTPVIVYDEDEIRKTCRAFTRSINENYDGNGLVLYASKAFSCKEMYRIVNSENMGVDVVSGGEIYTALSVGFPAQKIYFHGNNKKRDEIELAVDGGVGRIVVDNLTELKTLNEIAGEKGKTVSVMLRIKPGIDAHTHDFIRTGQIDSKFGFALETGEAIEAVKETFKMKNLSFVGLHCHIGSQIFDVNPFVLAAKTMMDFIKEVRDETGASVNELNLGGGFGIKYVHTDNPTPYYEYMTKVASAIKKKAAEYSLPVPFVLIEPGRSIVGAAAVTLYTVGAVKRIPFVRTYISIDGGMGDNPRYILYGAQYQIHCANRMNDEETMTATVAGKCCESGDLIQENVNIAPVEPGDIIAVFSTGAYNYSMASNYNRIPRPPVAMIKDGKARLIIRAETYEDITKNDI